MREHERTLFSLGRELPSVVPGIPLYNVPGTDSRTEAAQNTRFDEKHRRPLVVGPV